MTMTETIQEVADEMGIKSSDRCRGCRASYGSKKHRAECIDGEDFESLRRMRGWSRRSKWITPPCAVCNHTRTVHERQMYDRTQELGSCLIDKCRCQMYEEMRAAVERATCPPGRSSPGSGGG